MRHVAVLGHVPRLPVRGRGQRRRDGELAQTEARPVGVHETDGLTREIVPGRAPVRAGRAVADDRRLSAHAHADASGRECQQGKSGEKSGGDAAGQAHAAESRTCVYGPRGGGSGSGLLGEGIDTNTAELEPSSPKSMVFAETFPALSRARARRFAPSRGPSGAPSAARARRPPARVGAVVPAGSASAVARFARRSRRGPRGRRAPPAARSARSPPCPSISSWRNCRCTVESKCSGESSARSLTSDGMRDAGCEHAALEPLVPLEHAWARAPR